MNDQNDLDNDLISNSKFNQEDFQVNIIFLFLIVTKVQIKLFESRSINYKLKKIEKLKEL